MNVIAHRGASAYAPENTFAAFELARKQNAYGIELDAQRTADGNIVVIHDFTLDRTSNGSGAVASKTLAELRALDFGGWFAGGDGFSGEKIPTLDEVLDYIAGNNMVLNIELKVQPTDYNAGMIKLAADKIKAAGVVDRIIVSSFDHRSLVDIKEYFPALKTGILYSCNMYNVWDYAAAFGADFIHPMHQNLTADTIAGCRARGIGVNAWTADASDDIKRLRDIGADAVITNRPDEALACINAAG